MQPIIIKVRAPFDFARTAKFLRFTEQELVDTFDSNRYRRLIHFDDQPCLLNVAPHGTCARSLSLAVTITPEPPASRAMLLVEAAARIVRRIFSVHHDLRGFERLVADDPVMGEIAAAHRGLRLACWPSIFESLTISILAQQISTTVAMILKRRLVERFGAHLDAEGGRFYAFPRDVELVRVTPEELRTLGISTAKALSIIELARTTADGQLNTEELERQDNESIIARLSRLRGVGRWTAEWCLILHFGRTNVFPAGDLALRSIVAKYYNNSLTMSEREVRVFAEGRWKEWASYVAVHIIAGLRTGMITLRPQGSAISAAPHQSTSTPQ